MTVALIPLQGSGNLIQREDDLVASVSAGSYNSYTFSETNDSIKKVSYTLLALFRNLLIAIAVGDSYNTCKVAQEGCNTRGEVSVSM